MFDGVEFFVSFRFAEGEEFEGGGGIGGVLLFQGGEAGEEDLLFGSGGWTCEDEAEGVFETRVGLRRGEEDAFAEGAGGLDVGEVVERGESVEGRVGARSFDGAVLAAGDIEEERGADDAAPENVEAAAVERVAVVLDIFLLPKVASSQMPAGW